MTQLMQSVMDESRRPVTKAAWRNVIGGIAEELAAQALGADRLNTGSREWANYCPDLRAGRTFYEVKAVGLSRQVCIYVMRLEKDREFSRYNALCYVLVRHNFGIADLIAAAPDGATAAQCRFVMEMTQRIFVIPFCYVEAICAAMTPRVFNRTGDQSHGSCQRGYERGGYCISLRRLIEACPHGAL